MVSVFPGQPEFNNCWLVRTHRRATTGETRAQSCLLTGARCVAPTTSNITWYNSHHNRIQHTAHYMQPGNNSTSVLTADRLPCRVVQTDFSQHPRHSSLPSRLQKPPSACCIAEHCCIAQQAQGKCMVTLLLLHAQRTIYSTGQEGRSW